jgi:hypothetical protein
VTPGGSLPLGDIRGQARDQFRRKTARRIERLKQREFFWKWLGQTA